MGPWGSNPDPLEEQPGLLTTEPSLGPSGLLLSSKAFFSISHFSGESRIQQVSFKTTEIKSTISVMLITLWTLFTQKIICIFITMLRKLNMEDAAVTSAASSIRNRRADTESWSWSWRSNSLTLRGQVGAQKWRALALLLNPSSPSSLLSSRNSCMSFPFHKTQEWHPKGVTP